MRTRATRRVLGVSAGLLVVTLLVAAPPDPIREFIEGTTVVLGPGATGFDLNGDGTDDVLGARNRFAPGGPAVLAFSGLDGSLIREFPTPHDVPADGTRFIPSINGDGTPDVLTAYVGTGRSTDPPGYVIAYNGATGAQLYTAAGTLNQSFFGRSVAVIGDVTGDDVPDFVAGGPGSFNAYPGEFRGFSGADGSPIAWLQRTGTGTDNLGGDIAALGDVNNDGTPDFAVSVGGADDPPDIIGGPRGRVDVISGDDGRVLKSVKAPKSELGTGRTIANAGDMDLDGRDDLAVFSNVAGVRVYSSAGWKVIRVFPAPSLIGAASNFGARLSDGRDVTGDGYPDILIGASSFPDSWLFLFSGAPTTSPLLAQIESQFPVEPGRTGVLTGDFDGDSIGDIVSVAPSGNLAILRTATVAPPSFKFSVPLVRAPGIGAPLRGSFALTVTSAANTVTVTLNSGASGAEYAVELETGPGSDEYTSIGTLTVTSAASKLVLTGGSTPLAALGVTSYAQLAGRIVRLRNASDVVVLSGVIPVPGPQAPAKVTGKITRVPNSVAPKASGKLSLQYTPATGGARFDATLRGFPKSAAPALWIEDAPGSGVFVDAGPFVKTKFTRDTAAGDTLPGGATTLAGLRGRRIEVRVGAAVALTALVP